MFIAGNHANYEPGRRFDFVKTNGFEIEMVSSV